jgi:tRNA (guanosine-2'-O-)-methyltransferase
MTPERASKIQRVLQHRQPDFTVIFENVWDPHNISAVLRTADCVGIYEVFIIYTQNRTSTKLGSKSSASAIKWLKVNYFYSVEECFAEVRKRYDKIYSTHLSADAKNLYDLDLTERVALVFGNEHEGVSTKALELSDGNFIIPQAGMIQSLNISVACAVSLYEGMRQRLQKGFYGQQRLGQSTFEQTQTAWWERDLKG